MDDRIKSIKEALRNFTEYEMISFAINPRTGELYSAPTNPERARDAVDHAKEPYWGHRAAFKNAGIDYDSDKVKDFIFGHIISQHGNIDLSDKTNIMDLDLGRGSKSVDDAAESARILIKAGMSEETFLLMRDEGYPKIRNPDFMKIRKLEQLASL